MFHVCTYIRSVSMTHLETKHAYLCNLGYAPGPTRGIARDPTPESTHGIGANAPQCGSSDPCSKTQLNGRELSFLSHRGAISRLCAFARRCAFVRKLTVCVVFRSPIHLRLMMNPGKSINGWSLKSVNSTPRSLFSALCWLLTITGSMHFHFRSPIKLMLQLCLCLSHGHARVHGLLRAGRDSCFSIIFLNP